MKQTFAVVILIVILFFAGIYFFLPNKNAISVSVKLNAASGTVQRAVASNMYRTKWLPKEGKQISANEYLLDDCTFKFVSDNLQSNVISIKYKNASANSYLIVMAQIDSSMAILNYLFENNSNPLSKVSNYFANRHIKKTTEKILLGLQTFVDNTANVYGVEMKRAIVKDSTLISIKATTASYPTVNEIYKNIEALKSFAIANGAKETNPPMLNVYKNADASYAFMVALPIDKWLDNNSNITAKRMLAGGNILESGEVKGGFYTVDNAIKQLENFRADNASISPAIPFQSLITDRSKESDTSKWITKLYFPVF
jgi:hypothetical protein